MTDPVETTEPVEVLTADNLPAATTDEQEPTEVNDDAEPQPDREAAKYRRRLRAVEAEHAATSALLERSQRQFVDHLAAIRGVQPAALWAAGTDLADLLADGSVDPERVAQACEKATQTLGLRRLPSPNIAQGTSNQSAAETPTWQGLISGSGPGGRGGN